jgi:hypothetical protein
VRKWAWRIIVSASCLLLAGTLGMWARAQWAMDVLSHQSAVESAEESDLHVIGVAGYRQSLELYSQRMTIRILDATHLESWPRDLAHAAGVQYERRSAESFELLAPTLIYPRTGGGGLGLRVADEHVHGELAQVRFARRGRKQLPGLPRPLRGPLPPLVVSFYALLSRPGPRVVDVAADVPPSAPRLPRLRLRPARHAGGDRPTLADLPRVRPPHRCAGERLSRPAGHCRRRGGGRTTESQAETKEKAKAKMEDTGGASVAHLRASRQRFTASTDITFCVAAPSPTPGSSPPQVQPKLRLSRSRACAMCEGNAPSVESLHQPRSGDQNIAHRRKPWVYSQRSKPHAPSSFSRERAQPDFAASTNARGRRRG